LEDGISPGSINKNFPAFSRKYVPVNRQKTDFYYLQPIVDIHLNPGMSFELEPGAGILHNYILLSIAVFILMIAIINYINMATVYYALRIKETGVRKVLGARRFQLVMQFFGESTILCFLSLVFSLLIIELLLPQFSHMIGKNISFSLTGDPKLLPLVGVLAIVVSLLSGAYPAFYISSFQPIKVLGSFFRADIKKGMGRKILVVVQLIIATFLIIGTMTIHKQLNYIDAYDVNYNKDNIIILPVNQTPIAHDHYEAFSDQVTKHP
ncbi:MAG: FtsX-like permease family protein, partial [bacterium]|nr:FtsX-like permease family protein [bacterium]